MHQNSFLWEVRCALLSLSFGAHLDCPPRPTEQWLYGWVSRYLNLSAVTITLARTHATRRRSSSASAMLLRQHYIRWAMSVICAGVGVHFSPLYIFASLRLIVFNPTFHLSAFSLPPKSFWLLCFSLFYLLAVKPKTFFLSGEEGLAPLYYPEGLRITVPRKLLLWNAHCCLCFFVL